MHQTNDKFAPLSFFGAEKESLRCRADGRLATTRHPEAMGTPLLCPWLTTDFLEAQIEIITTPQNSAAALHRELGRLTDQARRLLPADEFLWPSSAPCILGPDPELILARYGEKGDGPRRELYRQGLKLRGGARRQALCGLHLNWSPGPALTRNLPAEEISRRLVRAAAILSRDSWLLVWLGGASPCAHRSFLGQVDEGPDFFAPDACSLRLGPHGYRLEEQDGIVLDYSSPQAWGRSLQNAVDTPHPRPELRQTQDQNGHRIQIAGGLLQTEAELYSPVRPKALPKAGESLLQAFAQGRCEWLELRIPDLNPFFPEGCSLDFLETAELLFFLAWFESETAADVICTLAEISAPARLIATQGRRQAPDLMPIQSRLFSLLPLLPEAQQQRSLARLQQLTEIAEGRQAVLSSVIEDACRAEGFVAFHLRHARGAISPMRPSGAKEPLRSP